MGRANSSILRTMVIGAAVGLAGAIAIFVVTAWFLQPMSKLQRRALQRAKPPASGAE